MSRKTETIQLLYYLIEQYENNPDLEDIRLGQLLSNAIPIGIQLHYIEAKELQTNIEKFLKGVKSK
jgi:hypothetical protein